MRRGYGTIALRYAQSVVRGERPAAKWTKLACQRFLDDLARVSDPGFPYQFDCRRVQKALQFAELLPHVKGHWAIPQPGDPTSVRIQFEPFQVFERAQVFGWVEKATGFRRFRIAYIERPRKNAKSTDAAIYGLYCLGADGEFGAEVYAGATTEKQAWEVFRPAKQMAERTDGYRQTFGVHVHAKSLTVTKTGSRFEPVIGKPGDGASPSLAIIDEYHEHADSASFDTMLSGMGARQQPLLLVITTAGESLESPCYMLHEQVQKMLDGSMPNERLFGVIYSIDAGDDWTAEEALVKANPNYGVSVSAEFLKEQQRAALNDASKQNTFKTKHLNVWCQARSPWMNLEWWNRQADAPPVEEFIGEPCWVAFDLASRMDLVARGLIFRRLIEDEEHYYGYVRCYVPEATAQEPERRHYQRWVYDGHLVQTEGNDCDLRRILEDAGEDRRCFQMQRAGIDPWNSIGLRDGLQEMEVDVVEIPQTTVHFTAPMKALEALVKDGRFHHDGNPCLTWQVANVTVKEDANGNVFPRKERRENKIDGAVTLIMAMKLALLSEPAVEPGLVLL